MIGFPGQARRFVFTPLGAGLAYALVKGWVLEVVTGAGLGGFGWQSPLVFAWGAGLLMAMSFRPLLGRVPWRRTAAALTALVLLVALGPVSVWVVARLAWWAGAAPYPYLLPETVWPEIAGSLAAVGVMVWGFCPPDGKTGFRSLVKRLAVHPPHRRLFRLAGLAVGAWGFWWAKGWAALEIQRELRLPPLLADNPWETYAPLEWGPWAVLSGLALMRAFFMFAALVPVTLVAMGSTGQNLVVFFMFWFVLGEFAPLMQNQPYFSAQWLMVRIGLGLAEAFVLALAAAWLLANRPQEERHQPGKRRVEAQADKRRPVLVAGQDPKKKGS